MTREELDRASELLESAAADASGEAADRLQSLADQLSTLSSRDKGPDHGRLARIENALDELVESADADVAATIEEAHEQITAYRSGVEGV
ncbi:MAG: hypothetical protein ABEJ89_02015 [Haloarculaceae archaeon]